MPLGAYCEERLIAADRLVKLPDAISHDQAASHDAEGPDRTNICCAAPSRSKPGDTILFHAAAGGVGLIAGQWAKHLGATVIGTAGSPEKIALAQTMASTMSSTTATRISSSG